MTARIQRHRRANIHARAVRRSHHGNRNHDPVIPERPDAAANLAVKEAAQRQAPRLPTTTVVSR